MPGSNPNTPSDPQPAGTEPASSPHVDPEPTGSELPEGFVQVGTIVGTHGTDGRVRVEPATSNPERFHRGARLWLEGEEHVVQASGPGAGGILLVQIEGISSRERAHDVVGQILAVPQGDVPDAEPGTYYHFQLLGMSVEDTSGAALGTLTEVLETGSNDVYVVTGEGQEWLLPALADVIAEVDVEQQRMRVAIPDGLEPRTLTVAKPKKQPRRKRRRPPRRPPPPQG